MFAVAFDEPGRPTRKDRVIGFAGLALSLLWIGVPSYLPLRGPSIGQMVLRDLLPFLWMLTFPLVCRLIPSFDPATFPRKLWAWLICWLFVVEEGAKVCKVLFPQLAPALHWGHIVLDVIALVLIPIALWQNRS